MYALFDKYKKMKNQVGRKTRRKAQKTKMTITKEEDVARLNAIRQSK